MGFRIYVSRRKDQFAPVPGTRLKIRAQHMRLEGETTHNCPGYLVSNSVSVSLPFIGIGFDCLIIRIQ